MIGYYFIKTFGCQANIADSQKIAGILDDLGYWELTLPKFKTETEENKYVLKHAEVFVINSCAVRQKSEDKVYGLGRPVKQVLTQTGKKPIIILAGCVVGGTGGERPRYPQKLLQAKTMWVDYYLSPHEIEKLPKILGKQSYEDFGLASVRHASGTHAYVNISYGCDNFCSYCVVPYSRGAEVSRSKAEILKEVNALVAKGIKEITLCGQNVNSWALEARKKFKLRTGSKQKLPFVALLKSIHSIPGLDKIDFISSNPFDFTDDLVNALKLPKISNYIHIAVQSGNNEVLKRMNRRHTVEEFVTLAEKIKKVKPELELGTDFIVGFPGETKTQFMDTVKLVKKVKFNVAFISMYSPRKGTTSERFMEDDVSKVEKKRRCAYLTKVWKESKI